MKHVFGLAFARDDAHFEAALQEYNALETRYKEEDAAVEYLLSERERQLVLAELPWQIDPEKEDRAKAAYQEIVAYRRANETSIDVQSLPHVAAPSHH